MGVCTRWWDTRSGQRTDSLSAMTLWHAYTERHTLTDSNRKAEGRDARLGRTPDEVIHDPEQVAAWVSAKLAMLGRAADDDGRRWNALTTDQASINRSLARKGKSVYASVRLTTTEVVDICVESVPA
jgi:hypothetical protein